MYNGTKGYGSALKGSRRYASAPRQALIEEANETGFALIELLVAIVLMGFLSATLFQSIRLGGTAWRMISNQSAALDETLRTQIYLRRVIGDVYPFYFTSNNANGRIAFDGHSNAVSFLASMPDALGGAGRSKYTLAVDRNKEENNLTLVVQPELVNPRDASNLTLRSSLLSNIASIELSYFGRNGIEPAGSWHDVWVAERSLPQAMRLRVKFPAGDRRSWPDLIIAFGSRADVGCTYDPFSKGCLGR